MIDVTGLLPGGTPAQVEEAVKETIAKADVDSVVIGTPIDLGRVITIDKPHTRVTYELDDYSDPSLGRVIAEALS